jgi:hypothetical protein
VRSAERPCAGARAPPASRRLLLVAHGTLHLLGWSDATPARRAMNARAAALARQTATGPRRMPRRAPPAMMLFQRRLRAGAGQRRQH